MNLSNLLTEDQILLSVKSESIDDLFHEMVKHLDDLGVFFDVDKKEVFEKLKKREQQMSTGVGYGVAIPHIFLPNLRRVTCIFGISEEGIPFSSPDGIPVQFIFLFLMPESDKSLHLSLLASLGRFFNNPKIRKSLSEVTNRAEILTLFKRREL